jgi:hypothetical protein
MSDPNAPLQPGRDEDDDMLERLREGLAEHPSHAAQAEHLAAIHAALIADSGATTIYSSPNFGIVYYDPTGRREQLDESLVVLIRTTRGQERPDVSLPGSPQ